MPGDLDTPLIEGNQRGAGWSQRLGMSRSSLGLVALMLTLALLGLGRFHSTYASNMHAWRSFTLPAGRDDEKELEDLRRENAALLERLRAVEHFLQESEFNRFNAIKGRVHCPCELFCTGQCFATQCGTCPPSAFNFPGGDLLCDAAGPLGTGLLCHVNHTTGLTTTGACCQTLASNPQTSCVLQAGSCCASGDCLHCPEYPRPAVSLPRLRDRSFDPRTHTCSATRPVGVAAI